MQYDWDSTKVVPTTVGEEEDEAGLEVHVKLKLRLLIGCA